MSSSRRGKLGKIKTTLQMLMTLVILLDIRLLSGVRIDWALITAAVLMTVWSGVDYFVKNRAVFAQGNSDG